MLGLLFAVSAVVTVAQLVKESCEKPIPAENWGNMDLWREDVIKGVPIEQRMKNLENGKYKLKEKYPEPHRDPKSGKIIIENCKLFDEDCKKYGVVQAYKWVDQGKYNLTQEELKKEEERIREHYKKLFDI